MKVMKRFFLLLLPLFLTAMLCFQNVAIAGLKDNGDMEKPSRQIEISPGQPSRLEVFLELIKPGVANPVGSQPASGETVEAFRERTGQGDRRDRPQGAGGGDAGQRERNKESGHKGHGGPL
jgi:hypothetical protein